MKIVFIGVKPNSPHFETQLELMLEHAAKGDELVYFHCDRAIPYCDSNPNNDQVFCHACVVKRRRGLEIIQFSGKIIPFSALFSAEHHPRRMPLPMLAGITDISEMKPLMFDTYDYGESVMSSVYSMLKTCYPRMQQAEPLMRHATSTTLALYVATRRLLQQERPGLAYFFNGRSATSRCFLRACQAEEVPFMVHERGSRIESYSLWPNTIPHNMEWRSQEVIRLWERNPNEAEKRAIAAEYFKNLRKGKRPSNFKNYLVHQQANTLPVGWLENERRITLFTSTETELHAVENLGFRRLYPNLPDAMNRIVEGLQQAGFKGKLAIRMHPNSQDEAPEILARFRHAQHPMVLMIYPHEKVDSYELVQTSEKVVVFNSTIGIESVRMGRPIVTLNSCTYCALGVTNQPRSHAEAIQMIMADLPVPDASKADYFGYFMSRFGYDFKYVVFKGQGKKVGRSSGKCSVLGKKLRSPWWMDQIMKLKKKYPRLEKIMQSVLYPRLANEYSRYRPDGVA